ncbi:C-C motif chemokine 3-like [Oryx dammah]|uniref:C-C motif chemokine 3-like n=1 Tax=Oryx dammah TaxID=59534 RepID=UPI001A9BD242|nr:C-C motif chemokine 3-like [Oryx dammah]
MEAPGAALAVLLLTAALSAHTCSATQRERRNAPTSTPRHCLLQVCLTLEGLLAAFPLNKDLPQSVLSLTVGANTPADCCFSFVSRQIPRKLVDDYYETSSQCSKPGVIFWTKRGRQVCADPSEDWVQEYITDLELNP